MKDDILPAVGEAVSLASVMEVPGRSGIYCLRCRSTGKVYVGQSINLLPRVWDHYSALKRGRHIARELQRDINSFGIESLDLLVLEWVEPDEAQLLLREGFWIEKYDATNPAVGYNTARGVTEEGRARKRAGLREEGERARRVAARKFQRTTIPCYHCRGRGHAGPLHEPCEVCRAEGRIPRALDRALHEYGWRTQGKGLPSAEIARIRAEVETELAQPTEEDWVLLDTQIS